jgi:biopolymer transport protein ExbD
MKKFLIIFLMLLPALSFSQKVQNTKTKEVFDLKEKQKQYCSVVIQQRGAQMGFFVGMDELGYFAIVDDSGKEIEFKTIVSIMNYMFENGWEFVGNIGGTDGAAPQYYFKKRT